MIRISLMSSIILGFVCGLADAQQAPSPAPAGRTYQVAFWFETERPISSLKYQVYDVAKGEYDEKAVARWLDLIQASHFTYLAFVREIKTGGEPGATEAERLASAIEKEKERWTRLQMEGLKTIPKLTQSSQRPTNPLRSQPIPSSRTSFDRPAPGAPGGLSNPPTSPIPYPYRSRPL